MKTMYFNIETTGYDDHNDQIIQFSAVIENDGKAIDAVDLHAHPSMPNLITEQLEDFLGLSRDEIMANKLDQTSLYECVAGFLAKHVDRYDPLDKIVIVCYGLDIHRRFLKALFQKYSDRYLFSYIDRYNIDIQNFVYLLLIYGHLPDSVVDLSLKSVCKELGIRHDHPNNALSDAKATRLLSKWCEKHFDFTP